MNKFEYTLDCGSKKLDLSKRTHIMGVLNVTPDSFSDGGKYFDTAKAVEHAIRMETEGADIIDIGGESTRPGAKSVSVDEELNRVLPVIKALNGKVSIPISIDTQKSEVAEKAIENGAQIVNDISALRSDLEMKEMISQKKVPVILMHMQGRPENMQHNPQYDDLIQEISHFLEERIQVAQDAGIDKKKIIVDPGIGFGKSVKDNFEIIQQLHRFRQLDYPILMGVSRKSFIGKSLNISESERLMGTAAAVAASILHGAHIVRVHDVKQMVQVVKIVNYIQEPDLINEKDN